MIKKDKIFVFLVVLLSVIILFSSSVFASTDTCNFTGFDGEEHTIPPFDNSASEYKYYIGLKYLASSGIRYSYLFFNDNLDVKFLNGGLTISSSSGRFKIYACSPGDSHWVTSANAPDGYETSTWDSSSSPVVIDCHSDLLVYKSKFVDQEDFFLTPLPLVLAPIMEVTPMEGVLQEIVEILPIVLMIIVGLIGLRKALQMLSVVLHRS